ncbi:membrane protein of ER body-like protein [Rutidosis leptorrhynchoides]|uniref:membrane protein of ER body-like protein n=1 Tax=Rutidosis leptorrhynchoides TaxID=125765 RepID=UPI003A9A57DD
MTGRLPSSSSDAANRGKEIAAAVIDEGAKKGGLLVSSRNPIELPPSSSPVVGDDVTLQIVTDQPEVANNGRLWLGYNGVFAEILKSIVYGGLMEVIASLSIVASAAASDATTLNIISVALASLIGGVFIIANNLWDLRNDGCNERTIEQTENKTTNRYKELLGQVEYFPLHAFFAILSFIVFGMVPPLAYGYTIHETNDKDYTVAAVAVASLLCVSLLAIFKAYINKCTFFEYVKTVVYYVTAAVSASGVSYVAGNLVTRLLKEYGLFDASSNGGVSLIPGPTTVSLASF